MDRRGFLQTTGLTAVAALAARSSVAATDAKPETKKIKGVKTLPDRAEVKVSDTWDLSALYPNDNAWEKAFLAWQDEFKGYAAFQGHLADSAEKLAECIKFDLDISRVADRLAHYADLKSCEDLSNGTYLRLMGRIAQAGSKASQASSFIRPEILAIPQAKMDEFLAQPALAPYKLMLTRILRFKPHTLSAGEERLLAMQSEMAGTADAVFSQLNNADMKFDVVENDKGERLELSHATFVALLSSPDRDVRENAFRTYYKQYAGHAHTLAASLNGSIQGDIYYAKARNFPSALDAALFPDVVPPTVYDNLLASVHRQLPALYRYYDLRRRKMHLKDLHHYDIYVPILSTRRVHHTWDEAVKVIMAALAPLGSEYCGVLRAGLEGRWCDRYENRGKRSGAFSAGSYDGKPYILMNYQPDVLDSVFTLAHEGGHSMHSHSSAKTQPYTYYNYVIFVAEVASTFNETLLSRHLLKNARDDKERAYLLNREIDSIKNTVFRQTMFAEFEKLAHASAEAGEPLTLDRFKEIYHGLLRLYFGPEFAIDKELDLECLRIPHFYRGFYVYKYATGMSAAIALANRVLGGGPKELNDYLGFLQGGCSKDPLDLLRGAGVDMEKPEPVNDALAHFADMVQELDSLI